MSYKRLSLSFILIGLALSLNGCFLIYKPDIKQGNILTVQKINEIRPGMSKNQVIELLGNPILINMFAENQMIYVYTIQPGHGSFQAQQLRIYFENGRVTKHTSNVHPL